MINPSRKLPIFIQKLVKLALFSFLCAKTIINKSLSIFIIIYHYIIPVGLIHYCQACFVTKKQKILGISTPPPYLGFLLNFLVVASLIRSLMISPGKSCWCPIDIISIVIIIAFAIIIITLNIWLERNSLPSSVPLSCWLFVKNRDLSWQGMINGFEIQKKLSKIWFDLKALSRYPYQ